MNGWLLVRVAGIVVGIYALLKLATAAGAVTYTTWFHDLLETLSSILGLDLVLQPLKVLVILPALEYIRSFDIPIPPLQDHWQQAFVLTWLMTAAYARNTRMIPISVALGLAFICTLPFCVAAGTMPAGSSGVAFLPFAGFFVFYAVEAQLQGRTSDALQYVVIAVACAAIEYFFGVTREGPLALKALAVGIGITGLTTFLLGLLIAPRGQRLDNQYVAIGFDITAAMLGAFGLATAFADPPLF